VEAEVWTERMVSALENGVEGGKWLSLIDKVSAPATLALAYEKVAAKGGAAGVDGQSLERFAARRIWPSCRLRCGKGATVPSRLRE
jgi:RNA-directed DNA polymerase